MAYEKEQKICDICGGKFREDEIVECIVENSIVNSCKKCVESENGIIITRPTKEQLEEAERPYTVHELSLIHI